MRATVGFVVVASSIFLAAVSVPKADGLEDLDAAWVKAVKSGDVNAVVDLYAANAVMYPPDGMEARGTEAIRKSYIGFLGSMTVKDVVFLEQNYTTKGPISVGWGRFILTGEPKGGGAPVKMEGRFTSVAEKKDGKWRYINDHASVPVPPAPAAGGTAPSPKP